MPIINNDNYRGRKNVNDTLHGGVGGKTTTVSVTPTIDTDAYTAGDAVGGRLEFTNAVGEHNKTGVLQSVIIIDDDQEQNELELWLFDQAFTATADDAAFAPSDADLANCIGVVSTADGTYYNASANGVCTIRNIGLVLNLQSTTLYGQLVTRGTEAYTAATDLTIVVGILQD